jgi:NADPH:quinone reductase-like Zn-dependent oxidoreductase
MGKMKALFLRKEDGTLVIRETDIPQPGAGEVLVKIAAAPVNPSDIAGIKDALNGERDLETFIPGNEGCGMVVASGKGLLPAIWKGRRVACASKGNGAGTWAEFMVTNAGNCFPLNKNISDAQGSMTLVNPLTAISFIEMAKKGRHKAIINNAAASALGRMVEHLCKKEGIPLVNIVRRDAQLKALRDAGSEFVLNSSESSFTGKLQSLSDELGATILFDSVCGPGFHKMVEALPCGSSVVVYGNLSPDQYVSVDPGILLGKDITISGFYLGNQAKKNGLIKNLINLRKVSKLMRKDMKICIRAIYPLDKAQEAVDEYLKNMTAGKVILQP